ncbi:MAG: D-alanine--poly(phosphoribitol) ligase subunit DltA [Bacillota bacterium]|nr:D-alanine--poly(phosphoribitol) ligase subunit DltA [Bacillota bacterium]
MVLEKLKEAASLNGKKPAFCVNGKSITYDSLWVDSGKLANSLERKMESYRGPLIVYGHKDPLMLTCFFACVKSGRAYCPVDVSMPVERVRDIAEKVNAPYILAAEELELKGQSIISPSDLREMIKGETGEIGEDCWVKPEDLFYIIFTSGSTGTPKGVQITYENLNNFVNWSMTLGTDPEQKKGKAFLNQAPFSFDLSVMDIYTCLCSGGTLWSIPKSVQSNPEKLMECLAEGNINYWVSTPSFADICLADKSFCSDIIPDMEAFLFCGETLSLETAGRLRERFPNAKVINTYGPTESTVAVTGVEITDEILAENKALPVGRPKPGTYIKIIDSEGKSIGDGEKGEIMICGDTVSTGYFKDKEKTDSLFSCSGEKSYRTGDEGYLSDGMLYYCGRIDLQVKLHGYRIELGDIEANLVQLPEVIRAAVVPKRIDGKIKYLAGFVVCEGELPEDKKEAFARAAKIKEGLKKKLPDYMVPKKIVFRESLPVTDNGKTDRRKLEDML